MKVHNPRWVCSIPKLVRMILEQKRQSIILRRTNVRRGEVGIPDLRSKIEPNSQASKVRECDRAGNESLKTEASKDSSHRCLLQTIGKDELATASKPTEGNRGNNKPLPAD